MKAKKKIGMDVGGSHVSARVFNEKGIPVGPSIRKPLLSDAPVEELLSALASCIRELHDDTVSHAGIAFPGPFDYKNGVCAIADVGGKFRHLFGLHLGQALKDASGIPQLSLAFFNDAHCFAAGVQQLHQMDYRRTVMITLGTGFGSAFVMDGQPVSSGNGIPLSGGYYNEPFRAALADDYFSTRWLLSEFERQTGESGNSVAHMTAQYPAAAKIVFQQFGDNLGAFLRPWLEAFGAAELVIGGNIARADHLYGAALRAQLNGLPLRFIRVEDTEDCIITGAASLVTEPVPTPVRKTTQAILPVNASNSNGVYNLFPAYTTGLPVYEGYASLASRIAGEHMVIIDGYGGMLWETFRAGLHTALAEKEIAVRWYHIDACLKPPAAIDAMLADSLNAADPVFGKRFKGGLSDYFDSAKLGMINAASPGHLHIIYGTGAALCGHKGMLLYADVPKNEIQYRFRAGSATNIGTTTSTYKRCYFADWPVLNQHKQSLLPQIDIMIDAQRPGDITWMSGADLRHALQAMLTTPFRARPWFEAGIWGGDWMKQHLSGLNPDEVNYAWSFELITPENGIVLEGEGRLLEISFDFLLYQDNVQLLGKAADRFGTAFPIRFDFLDTYNGGNLSIQCHPQTDYIREHFGEQFTQDETYYILDCEPGASVYLGFQDNIEPAAFRAALEDALANGTPLPEEKYVQRFNASKHDLFLIPNGTVHASGRNNLVLEISSTPYIFTFKMYDWLRTDLNGKPRPIHLDHAFANLDFDRKGDEVSQQLISRPQLVKTWTNGQQWQLPTNKEHFYTVDRYEFTGEITISTNGQCHICMLVEGDQIDVSAGDCHQTFRFAETFVIPAGAGGYTCTYKGQGKAYLVVAYVKDSHCS